MKMKRYCVIGMLLVFLLLVCMAGAYAESGSSFFIRGVSQKTVAEGKLGVRIVLLDSSGRGVSAPLERFSAVVENETLAVEKDSDATTGYIFVIDISKFYADNDATASKAVQNAITKMTNLVTDRDGILALWVGEKIETSGQFVSRVQASVSLATEFEQKHKTGKKKDDAVLYNAIAQAVNLAENPSSEDDYDFYNIIIFSDGFNTQSAGGNASLNSIQSSINSQRPIGLSAVLFYNRAVTNQGKLSAANANRQLIQELTDAVKGYTYLVDYHREAELNDQIQTVADSFAAEITGTTDLIMDIHNVNTPHIPHVSSVTILMDRQGETVDVEIPWNMVPEPEVTAEAGPTPVIWFARYGDEGSENVRLLQTLLAQKGWFTGLQDGNFNEATRTALVSFYSLLGRTAPSVDGQVALTETDWTILSSMNPFPSPSPIPPFAMLGDRESENVRRLQEFLQTYGFYTGAIDGNFYNATSIAYQSFCQANDRQISRIGNNIAVTEDEWIFLQNIPPQEVASPTPAPTQTPGPTPTPTPAPDAIRSISLGDQDQEGEHYVSNVQARLDALGYFKGLDLRIMPGLYDEATQQAVQAFNRQNRREDPSAGQTLSRNDVEYILTGGEAFRSTMSDRMRRTLTREIPIGSFAVRVWHLLIVCAVLTLILVVLLIVNLSGGGEKKANLGGDRKSGKRGGKKDGSDAKSGEHDVTFEITYQGSSRTEVLNPDDGARIVPGLIRIGRRSREMKCDLILDAADTAVSREHAEIYFEGDVLRVRNISQKMPIIVNGRTRLEPGQDSEETMVSLNNGIGNSENLYPGDELTLGHHTIRVQYVPKVIEDLPTGVEEQPTTAEMNDDELTTSREEVTEFGAAVSVAVDEHDDYI